MKKILLIIVLITNIVLPTFANNTNKIRDIYFNEIDVINSNNNIDYRYGGIGISATGYSPDNSKLYESINSEITFYDVNLKKILKDTQENFYNESFVTKLKHIPNNADSYKISVSANPDFDCFNEIRKRINMTTSIIQLGYALSDFYTGNYAKSEELLNRNKGFLISFNNSFKQSYPNGYLLDNGNQIFFENIRTSCQAITENIRPYDIKPCATMILDINGFEPPNENSTKNEIKDRFIYYVYANKIVPDKNSIEELLKKELPTTAQISSVLKKSILSDYKKFVKSIKIIDTNPIIEIIANNKTNKTLHSSISVKFYDSNKNLIDIYNIDDWEIYPANNEETSMHLGINFNKLSKEVKYFDIIITNK